MQSLLIRIMRSSKVWATFALVAILAAVARGQGSTAGSATIDGTVCDTQHHPLTAAVVALENGNPAKPLVVQTDAQGRYHFADVPAGPYTLRATLHGYADSTNVVVLAPHETRSVTLLLNSQSAASPSGNTTAQSIEFSDQPEFTVAGLTDPTNLGGHGSDVVMRTKETLAKDTVSLSRADIAKAKERVDVLRNQSDSAELHVLLGEIAESEGRPLEAVKEYEHAAAMDPSEANLFAWGAELLLHRALDPASEVFAKGNRLFPQSVRMLVGLGVTSYARGHREEAMKQIFAASDLSPSDPSPYLFLGRIQEAEKLEPPGVLEKLNTFAGLHPQDAMANYYYAVALAKTGGESRNFELRESLLQKAIHIDSHFGDAYLQLGVLYAEKKDFPKAIAAYQNAILNTALPEEAHFRLAQVYRQTGEPEKAKQEIERYNQISKEKTKVEEHDRHEIGQFVYTLRGRSTPSQAPPSNP